MPLHIIALLQLKLRSLTKQSIPPSNLQQGREIPSSSIHELQAHWFKPNVPLTTPTKCNSTKGTLKATDFQAFIFNVANAQKFLTSKLCSGLQSESASAHFHRIHPSSKQSSSYITNRQLIRVSFVFFWWIFHPNVFSPSTSVYKDETLSVIITWIFLPLHQSLQTIIRVKPNIPLGSAQARNLGGALLSGIKFLKTGVNFPGLYYSHSV